MELEGFQRLILGLERRARLVRGLERARLPLSFALGLILGYQLLLLRLFGPVGGLQLQAQAPWLAAFAAACGLGGFLYGYFGRLELAELLFRVDRRLGLHERLSSLYELYRGRGRAEFIPLISARLPAQLEPALARAFPIRKRGFLLPAGLLLLVLFLGWAGRPISPLFPLAREKRAELEPQGRLKALEEELRALEAELELGAPASIRRPARKGSLQERLEALEEEIWGPEAEPALQGELAARLAQALSARGGEGQPAPTPESEASWHAALEELARLASRLKGGALKELLALLGRAPEGAGAGRTEEGLWRELALAEALVERLAEARRRLEGPEQPGLAQRAPGREGEGQGPPQESGLSSGAGEGPSSTSAEGAPGGEEAGTTPGEWPTGSSASSPLSWPAPAREFYISGELGETGEIERLITRGTPFEPGGLEEGEPHLRLDFQRVQAVLEERAIPPEAQGVVQRYFLIITTEGR